MAAAVPALASAAASQAQGGGAMAGQAGPATNRSINFNGPSGGASSEIGMLLQYASGGEANGGYTPNGHYAGLTRAGGLGGALPIILIGGVLLLVLVLTLKH